MPSEPHSPPPALSVVMPAFEAAQTVGRAIASILEQTFRDLELIVVDDGSTDRTGEIVRALARTDPRVVLLAQDGNRGVAAALNAGIERARAGWIARMDADDIARPERFDVQMRAVEGRPDLALLGSHAAMVDLAGRRLPCEMRLPLDHDDIVAMLYRPGWPIIHPTVLLRRSAVLAAGGYDPRLRANQDHDLFLRLADHGRLENLAEVLLDYCVHPRSITTRGSGRGSPLQGIVREARRRRMVSGKPIPKPQGDAPGLVVPLSVPFELALLRGFVAAPGRLEDAPAALAALGGRWRTLVSLRARTARLRRSVLDRLPDGIYTRLKYAAFYKRIPRFARPRGFTARTNALKLHDRNPLRATTADKLAVRDHVGRRIGSQYLVPLLRVWSSDAEVSFEGLPQRFVIKPTHGSGMVHIVLDRDAADLQAIRRRCARWLRTDYSVRYHEWVYRGIPRKILVEESLCGPSGERPATYRFHVFGSRCEMIQVDQEPPGGPRRNVFDRDFGELPYSYRIPRADHLERPPNLVEMRTLAEALGREFSYIRVDFYSVEGRTFFSELTSFPAAGFGTMDQGLDDYLDAAWQAAEARAAR